MPRQSQAISDQLRAAIRASGLTHYRIAKEAGISPSMLDHFIRGERSLRLETVDKIAAALGYRLAPAQRR